MYCKECGKEVGASKVCPNCGVIQESRYESDQITDNQTLTERDVSSFGFLILSLFIPIVGIILYVVWHKDFPAKARSCLKGFVAGIVLYIVVICCFFSFVFKEIAGEGNTQSELFGTQDTDSGLYNNTVIQTVPYE